MTCSETGNFENSIGDDEVSNFPPSKFLEYDGLSGVPPATPLWNNGISEDTTVFLHGESSIKFDAGTSKKLMSEWFPVGELDAYVTKALVKGTAGDILYFEIELADKDFTTPYTALAPHPVLVLTGGVWEQDFNYFTPTAGFAFARIVFGTSVTTTGALWVDKISIQESKYLGMMVLGTGGGASYPFSTLTKLFPNPASGGEYDPFALLNSPTNDTFTLKRSGTYSLRIHGHLKDLAAGKYYTIQVNAGTKAFVSYRNYSSGNLWTTVSHEFNFTGLFKDDTVYVSIFHNDPATLNEFEGIFHLTEI